ncbi:hypothetical protein COU37_04285 [Candidatus Micrarchaeota archaeon CG10_big_fil_rev_8_21_14_0_10_45_29]|nr:MAG: hypothetical protein COU37_04285 [Candidatus Micrarchaeota archaeon CG10_big_fil_rev_8_21_14_0_10_45_29]
MVFSKIEFKFSSKKGAEAAKKTLSRQLANIGKSKISIMQNEKNLHIKIEDEDASKRKAAYFSAMRLCEMLRDIDGQV